MALLTRHRTAVAAAVAALLAAAVALLVYSAVQAAWRSSFVERSREETALVVDVVSSSPLAQRPLVATGAARRSRRVEVVSVSQGRVSASDTRLGIAAVPASVRAPRTRGELPAAEAAAGIPYLVVGDRTADGITEIYVFHSTQDLQASMATLRGGLALAWLLSCALVAGVVHAVGSRRRRRLAAHAEREQRFNADIAHELRTPLGAMVTAASLLDDADEVPERLETPIQVLVEQTRRLRMLVDDLLELARLEAGDYQPRHEQVRVAGLVEDVVAARGWRDHVDLVLDRSACVCTDRRALARIVVNLTANALRHGVGRARVRASRDGDDVVVAVVDDGPGVSATDAHELFGRFTSGAEGSGLGLAIARENAELVGAQLRVRSIAGVGTMFTLRMPGSDAPAPARTRAAGQI